MRTFKHLLIGLISIAFISGSLAGVMAPEGQAATALLGSVSITDGGGSGNCDVPPTWMGPIPGKDRWVPTYMDKYGKPHAYCDRQTGIVLEKSPSDSTFDWDGARRHCLNRTVGDSGQKGWRLLYLQELAALVDINSKSCTEDNLCLPDGIPFKNVQSINPYWSGTTLVDQTIDAWFVAFDDGLVTLEPKSTDVLYAWCGRGPSATDSY